MLYSLLFAAAVVGIVVQASVGFGFGFFVAPVAVAVLPPEQAVMLLLVLGSAVNALVLFGERREIVADRHAVAVMALASLPGLVAGVFVVQAVSRSTQQVIVGAVILGAAAIQARRGDVEASVRGRRPHLVAAGAVAGLFTTATSLNGPAVVLGYVTLGLSGARLRDSIAATLLALSCMGAVLLALTSTGSPALPPLWIVAVSAPLVVLGHRAGAAVFRGLTADAHRRLILVASVVAGMSSVVAGLAYGVA